MICSNRKYTITIFEAHSNFKINATSNKNTINYKCSNIVIYIYNFLKNIIIVLPLQNFINMRYKLLFEVIFSLIIIILLAILKYFFLCHEYF